MSFGENLQYLRGEAGLTQEQLAERLEVSRQSVSKWESDTSFPEMDKLLVLCDMFRSDLDTLLRGDAKASRQSDNAGYDAHMDRFSRMITAGVVLSICGFSAGGLLEGLSSAALRGTILADDRWSGIAFLMFVLAAVVLFIIGGIRHKDFCDHYPRIEPFYDEKTLAAWRQRFPVFIAVGTALCIGALILMAMLEGIAIGRFPAEACDDIVYSSGLLVIAAGVGTLTYGGMQNSKYHIEEYNRERSNEHDPRSKRLGAIQSAVMLAAVAAFLIYFYLWKVYDFGGGHAIGLGSGLIFALGGLLCAIISALFQKK